MKAQGATEYLVQMGVVLVIALFVIGILAFPIGSTSDAKKKQTDIHFKINEIGTQVEDESWRSITQGLVGYWKFDEGSGTSAADSRGSNTGTLYNGPTWVSGKSSYALSFDGANDYVRATNSNPLGNIYTVAWWQKNDGPSNGPEIQPIGLVQSSNQFYKVNGGNSMCWVNNLSGCTSTSDTIGEWTHYAYVSEPAQWRIYRNGALARTRDVSTLSLPTSNIDVGRMYGATWFWNGTIDEVMVFNRALSASEIRLLYENPGYPQ